jgi:hypothetical protein
MTEAETQPYGQQITEEVLSWPGVEAGPGRRGEFAFKLNGREIGHLHGDRSAHFSFPPEVWTQLKDEARIVEHPVFPGRVGPAARRLEREEDVRDAIAMMRLNYERIDAAQRRAA